MRQISLLLVLLSLLAPQLRAADAPATMRPGDSFDMRLTGVPEEFIRDIASLQYTIGPDGTVNIPHIGKTRASGLTSTQLEDAIQAKYIAGKIFTNPTVIVNVAQGARFVSISGGVKGPGKQQWTSDMTLGSAIGGAGGLGEFSNGKGIRIIRDSKVFGAYNFKDITKDPSRDPKLLPGDQVIVPE